jgi:hypothetical protein
MDSLESLINSKEPLSDSQIMFVFNQVGLAGDIILLKNDGPRAEAKFTVVILSGDEKFSGIRQDSDDLSFAIRKVLSKYIVGR